MTGRVAIFTCITNSYDDLFPQPQQSIPADYIAFMDQPHGSYPPPWIIRQAPAWSDRGARWASHLVKALPADYLPDYDVSIWIDGAMLVTSPDFARWAVNSLGDADICVWKHPQRVCIAEEARYIIDDLDLLKYRGQPLKEQAASYIADGYPLNNGLYALGTIARRHTPEIDKLGRMWLDEQERWSIMDQLSFPYVAWQLGIPVAVFPDNQLTNPYARFHNHRRED